MNSPDQFPDRMAYAIDQIGGLGRAAEKSGLSTSVLDQYRKGKSDPNRTRLLAIANAAKVDLLWLAAGTGTPDLRAKGIISIPRYDVRLSAGSGSTLDRVKKLEDVPFTSDFLRLRIGSGSPDNLAIFEAGGDSMEPTISDGDFVMVDLAEQQVRDAIYAFAFGDEARVKRLRKTINGIQIISDNADLYTAEEVTKNDLNLLQIIGRVVWTGRIL